MLSVKRALAGKNKKRLSQAMIPLLDMANHRQRAPFGNAQLRGHIRASDGHLEVVCDVDVGEGDELFLSYGDLGNAQLLQSHGFVESSPSAAWVHTVRSRYHRYAYFTVLGDAHSVLVSSPVYALLLVLK